MLNLNLSSLFQSCAYHKRIAVFQHKLRNIMNHLISHLIIDPTLYRTAPAAPGLSIIYHTDIGKLVLLIRIVEYYVYWVVP